MRMVSRTLMAASVSLVLSGCGGFSPGYSHRARPGERRALQCDGDEVLEVFNPLVQNVDIYVYADNGAPQFFISAGQGASTIPLAGTKYEHRYAGFEARVGNNVASDVRITRQCEKRSS
ncbi:MAG TPA: hypothetical protein VJO33_05240 [Gemmatimonadaceae bacterium]|nr:hypothetical protein [Gemmatimonadaceae bacterium]